MKKVTLLCCLFLGTTGLSQIHAADETSPLIGTSSDTSEYCIGSERDVKLFHRIQQYRKVRPHNYGLVSEDVESAKSLRIMGQQEFDNLVSSQDNKESLNHKLKKKGYVKINGTYIAVRGIEKENQPRVPSTFWSKLRTKLPDQSTYALVDTDQAFITREDLHEWALSGYDTQFSKSTWTPDTDTPSLVVPAHLQKEMDTVRLKAETEVKFRNEFVTHTNQFSPAVGAMLMHELGKKYGAFVETITGKALEEQYNLVHQVGKGSSEYPPNVTVLHWKPQGIEAKLKILLGGKGVCFDTGGYNLKTDPSDMHMDKGGALSQMALAELIMANNLPVAITLANGWVVNAISGEATNPFDVYTAQTVWGKDITVEQWNTDAEGRIVLAGILARHATSDYDRVITQSTLTGACLMALGEKTGGFYSPDQDLLPLWDAFKQNRDAMWPMPFDNRKINELKEGTGADLKTLKRPYGGSIHGAGFVREFVQNQDTYIHLDVAAMIDAKKTLSNNGLVTYLTQLINTKS